MLSPTLSSAGVSNRVDNPAKNGFLVELQDEFQWWCQISVVKPLKSMATLSFSLTTETVSGQTLTSLFFVHWEQLKITATEKHYLVVNKYSSGCRCEFTDWTEWGSCAASLGGGFQERKRNWKVKDGMTGDMCPTRPRHPDYTLQERRDGSPDGQINCLQVCFPEKWSFLIENIIFGPVISSSKILTFSFEKQDP